MITCKIFLLSTDGASRATFDLFMWLNQYSTGPVQAHCDFQKRWPRAREKATYPLRQPESCALQAVTQHQDANVVHAYKGTLANTGRCGPPARAHL